MNNREKLITKRSVQENKRVDNIEEDSVKKNTKTDTGNDSSQHYNSRVSGHSTPIQRKDYIPDIEDSPELDYRCSPISFPCTQDGGNEISWDWQTPSTKNLNEKSKPQSSQVETPKRTKQLQKKRNSNSPLLQKPLKRKQVKMENIENIGKLTAELKALTERMKNIQENYENHSTIDQDDTKYKEYQSKLLLELSNEDSDDIMIQVAIDNDKSKIDSVTINSNIKKSSSYEDLFDDSIDDSMVRCSQEVEEKLNLNKSKENEVVEVNVACEKKHKESHCITLTNSTDSSKSFSISKNSSSDTSSRLRTYSNNTSKMNSISNFSFSSSKNTSLQKGFSKNVMRIPVGKLQEEDLLDFPDDSFDDCLATCMEDDKLLTKLSEYDFKASNSGRNSSYSKNITKETVSSNNKQLSSNVLSKAVVQDVSSNSHTSSMFITDDLVENIEVITDKEAIQKSFPGKTALENRKFFKTKSLSDHCFYQSRNCNLNSKTNKASNYIVSSEKRFQSYSNNSSVSTTHVKSENSHKTNNFHSNNGMENIHTLNRVKEKGGGNCIVKYKSTSNLSSIKEVKASQSVQCTPEEIERKRLEAKMRLEAKRKLQQSGRMANVPSEIPIKKSVKR